VAKARFQESVTNLSHEQTGPPLTRFYGISCNEYTRD
jgi:hypothetical protein